jgi:hypothetical protein
MPINLLVGSEMNATALIMSNCERVRFHQKIQLYYYYCPSQYITQKSNRSAPSRSPLWLQPRYKYRKNEKLNVHAESFQIRDHEESEYKTTTFEEKEKKELKERCHPRKTRVMASKDEDQTVMDLLWERPHVHLRYQARFVPGPASGWSRKKCVRGSNGKDS